MKILLYIPTLLTAAPATVKSDGLVSANVQNYVGYAAIVFMMLLFIIAFLVMQRAFNTMANLVMNMENKSVTDAATEPQPAKKEKKKEDIWLKALSLRPMSEEKEILIEHDYDGIQELDNPTPAWFMWLFYGTIAFGICYLLVYHVFDLGPLQDEEYKTEVALADSAKKVYLSKSANQIDENTVKLLTDAETISAGKGIFTQNCAACHGADAQGVVGPNLTDDYWLHGGKINDLFKTIKYGVAAKGMPTWEKQLSPKQISEVANYIKSIHGTNPPNAKEPQGVKEDGTVDKVASK